MTTLDGLKSLAAGPLPADEWRRVVVDFNDTAAPYPRDARVDELVAAQAAQRPEAVAVVYGDRVLRYGELNSRAAQVAATLRAAGVRPGALVATWLERSTELVVALLGILKTGAAYLPLDVDHPPEWVAGVLEAASVRVVVTTASVRGRLREGSGVEVVSLDAEWERAAGSEGEDLSVSQGPGGHQVVGQGDGSSLAYVIYTSGSTGRPKGVAVPHRAITRLVVNSNYVRLGPEDCVGQASNCAFDAATFEIWGTLVNGARLVGLSRETVLAPAALARALQTEGITVLFLTTALFNQVAQQDPTAFRGIRCLLFGGEAVNPQWVREVLKHGPPERLLHVYGPTENTTFTSWHAVGSIEDDAVTIPIGGSISNTQMYVLDGDLQPVPIGEPGELYTGGDGLADGYWTRPDLTADRFIPDPFCAAPGGRLYRTGDLARWLPDGGVEFLGRVDHQVKIRGFRVELGEIEAVLRTHSAIRDASVVATGESADRRLVSYVVFEPERGATSNDIRKWLRDKLPGYMVPSAVIELQALPLTLNGKVDRQALPPVLAASEDAAREVTRPRTATESELSRIWASLLNLEAVGRDDDFFALGGHSLLVIQMISRVRERFRVELPVREVFENATVAALAAIVDAAVHPAADIASQPTIVSTSDHPLSFSQERVWFLQQLHPESLAYQFQATLRFRGPLDIVALERSLTAIVGRHEIFRTTFPSVEERPVQRVHPARPVHLPMVDLADVPEGERDEALSSAIARECAKQFDVTELPLIQWTLLRVRSDEHVLLHIEHHLLHDGWSFNVFLGELAAFYRAFHRGEPSPLQEPVRQFTDFARWQRAWLQGEVADAQLAYWRNRLADHPGVLQLPSDRPRPAVQSYRGAVLRIELPVRLARALRTFTRQQRGGVTLFMTLLAAFFALLHRYSGQDDLQIGCGMANRRWQESEKLIGMIINSVVLRARVIGEESFRRLIAEVRRTTLDAYANQDLPFERIVDELRPGRDLSHNPFFQVAFSFHDAPLPELDFPELGVELVEGLSNRSAKFDLSVIAIPRSEQRPNRPNATDEGIVLLWEYSTDQFDEETIRRMAAHYQRLLEELLAHPDAPVAELSLSSDAEQAMLRSWSSGPSSNYPERARVDELVAAQAAQRPEAEAVVYGDRVLRYGELDSRAAQVAARLRAAGVRPGALVATWLERSAELVVALLGILKTGAAYLPLDVDHPPEWVAGVLEAAGARVVVTTASVRGRLREGSGVKVVSLDAEWERAAGSEGEDLGVGEGLRAGDEVKPGDGRCVALVIYTSGSTGQPKGVAVPHRGITRMVVNSNYLQLGPDDCVGQTSNCAFDAATFEIWGTLINGARLVGLSRETVLAPPALARTLRTEGVTVLFLTTALFNQVAQQDPRCFAGLRTLLVGGEALNPHWVREVLKHGPPERFLNVYGPAENTTFTSFHVIESLSKETSTVPIGGPISDTQMYVLDPDLRPAAIGVPGELWTGGAGLADGYWARPDLTADRFMPSPFGEPGGRLYRTGDLTRYLADGSVEFLGRIDQQVKIRGFRIEPAEVEAVLQRHPAVREAVVLVGAGPSGGKRLIAYTVCDGRSNSSPEESKQELKRFAQEQLPPYMVPSVFVPLTSMPLNRNGKVDRVALAEMNLELEREPIVAAQSNLEARIADVWQQVLRLDHVGATENFFDVGGDSILSIVLVARLNQRGIRTTPKALFEHQTIRALAKVVEVIDGSTPASAGDEPVSGRVPLAPIQRVFFDQRLDKPQHWNQAVLLRAQEIDEHALRDALQALLDHHDALRLRFERRDVGWAQENAGRGEPVSLEVIDLAESGVWRLETEATRVQASLDLAHGPVFKAALFRLGEAGDRLLLAAHHLVVDLVSWRILVEDLEQAYELRLSGRAIQLPAKTCSYTQWAAAVAAYAETIGPETLRYWTEVVGRAATDLPVDGVAADGVADDTWGTTERVVTSLDAEATRELQITARQACRMETNEFLLAALGRALGKWTGRSDVLVYLEGHGRDALADKWDLGRTIGWFTALYPHPLATAIELNAAEHLRRVKEDLRRVPDRGASYGALRWIRRADGLLAHPEPLLSFNYHGQVDGVADGPRFRPAAESPGRTIDPGAPRMVPINVEAKIADGRLQVSWYYGRNRYRRHTIACLADDFLEGVRELTRSSAGPAIPARTPSDYPLVRLSESEVRTLPAGVEDVWPLAPIQHGVLFHALYEPDLPLYSNQLHFKLEGALQPQLFERAWQRIIDSHAVLRSTFRWQGFREPIQLVMSSARVDVRCEDLSRLGENEQQQHITRVSNQDWQRPYELDRGPLMRLALFTLAPDCHHVLWGFHHILLDGWSVANVLGELAASYKALVEGNEPPPTVARPYSDYLAWLARQDRGAAREFWRGQLSDFTHPTPVPRTRAWRGRQRDSAEVERSLSATSSAALANLARRERVTLSSVAHATWAVVLCLTSGQHDVVFGATVSGRPADLPDVEHMVGPFINAVPVRVRVDEDALFVDVVHQVNARLLSARAYEHSLLAEVQQASGVSPGQNLFESLVTYENYPGHPRRRALGAIRVSGMRSRESTHYELVLVVTPGETLRLRLCYDPSVLESATAEHLARSIETVMTRVAENSRAPISDLGISPAVVSSAFATMRIDEEELDDVLDVRPRAR